ncbi:PREDICTED: WAT1-related protein At5g07050-like [Nelumbo nucifera]|uniref:WAT1-related protein n=1 Tax=Nelumbo nucifera TaxID=4432 RepID=A0A1U7ZLX5_NELNU|nr:PREDICTED: WAT1-related protein At5g07050-like [Nelumbo nucifera]
MEGKQESIKVMERSQPYFLSIFSSACFAGFNIVSKVSLNKGMSRYVLVVYAHAIGMLTTAVLALLFERKNRPRITFRILTHIFILGLLGPVIAMTTFYAGMGFTSSAFASAMANLVPSMTLILAILFRMEKLNIFKSSSQLKIGGTLIAFAGATIMIIYKGTIVISLSSTHSTKPMASLEKDWVKGSLLLIVSNFSQAAYYILQVTTIKLYSAPISLTLLTCLMGAVQAAVMTTIFDRKASSWRLSWDIKLLAPIYCGVMVFGVTRYIQTLVIQKRGPVFVSAFRPVGTIIVAVMGLFILKEALHLGSILGAVLIFAGLYMVLWGKEKENANELIEKNLHDKGENVEP